MILFGVLKTKLQQEAYSLIFVEDVVHKTKHCCILIWVREQSSGVVVCALNIHKPFTHSRSVPISVSRTVMGRESYCL